MPVVYQSWQISKTVLLGQFLIVDLHEADAELVCLIIDVFQLLQGFGAFLAFRFVWNIVKYLLNSREGLMLLFGHLHPPRASKCGSS
jgi:predicted phosphodiesterase